MEKSIKNKSNKNYYIELCRFLACMAIFSYHASGHLVGGWIFVEFFFMLTGFFMVKHIHKRRNDIKDVSAFPITYTVNKMRRIIPYTTIAFIFYSIVTIYMLNLKGQEIVLWLLYLPVSILLLPGTGVMPYGVSISEVLVTPRMMSASLWYICSMVIAIPIALYILFYLGKKFGAYLVTVLPFFMYGYIIINNSTLNGWHDNLLGFWALNLRAVAGLLLGGGVYYLSLWWANKEYTKIGKILLTLIEILSFFSVFIIAWKTNLPYDILEILLFILSMSLSLSEKTYTTKLNFKIFGYLGKISLPIYCLHCTIISIISHWYPVLELNERNLVSFIIVLICAVILNFLIEIVLPKLGLLLKKFKTIIIISD